MTILATPRRRLLFGALGLLLVLAIATSAYVVVNRSNAQAAASATLTVFTGTVSVQSGGASATHPAATGEQVHNGDAIFTGPTTKAAINFPGGSITRLDSNTSLIITGIIATAAG